MPADPPQFREATDDDVAAVVDLVESAYRGDRSRAGWTTEADLLDGQRVDATMVGDALADDDATIVVAEQGGAIVGCCELRRATADHIATLGMFAVEPDRQAGGLGRGLLRTGEAYVVDRWGADRLRLQVLEPRTELLAWYRRRGYRPTGERVPFPYGDERFGRPRRGDLRFVVLERELGAPPPSG